MVNVSIISKKRLWAGYIVTGLTTLFLLMDGTMKLFKPSFVVQSTMQLGYPESTIVGIGTVLLCATLLYVIPRTSFLGAVLLTGYLGGAVASNVRAVTPLFNVLFPIALGALAWAGLLLRDGRLEAFLPLRSKS
jgi:DoxX-like family